MATAKNVVYVCLGFTFCCIGFIFEAISQIMLKLAIFFRHMSDEVFSILGWVDKKLGYVDEDR